MGLLQFLTVQPEIDLRGSDGPILTDPRLASSLDRQLKAADNATAEDLRETIKTLLAEWVPWQKWLDIPQ